MMASGFRRLAFRYQSTAARAALFFLAVAERLHRGGRAKPPDWQPWE